MERKKPASKTRGDDVTYWREKADGVIKAAKKIIENF